MSYTVRGLVKSTGEEANFETEVHNVVDPDIISLDGRVDTLEDITFDAMVAAVYDPQGIVGDAFDRANHTGTQTASTISDFDAAAGASTDVAANTAHRNDLNNPHVVTKDQVGLGEVDNLKANLAAIIPPTVDDDITAGYGVGSRWIDNVQNVEYVCMDNTAANAIWINIVGASQDAMSTTIYDPTAVAGDVFSMGNMVETATEKILTDTERTAIGTNSAKVSADGSVTTHNDVTDAGSGIIISGVERTAIGTNSAKVSADGSVTTHNDVTDAGSGAIITTAERTKVGFVSVTQAVDLDTIESDTATNNAKVSADGSVTTHNDVTDAGSGIIISGVERTAIGTNSAKVSADGSVTTHNDVTDAGSGIIISGAERTKVGFVSVTQAVDLDTIESDTATNNAKVSADGSVTTHNDVTDAGSGIIISGAERTAIGTNSAKVSADGSVTTHNDVTNAGSGAIITTAERNKLGNLNEGFLGIYADETALTTAHATASAGQFTILQSTDTVWIWDAEAGPAAWVNSGGTSIGDMFKSVYDPTSVNGDAFSMGNMVETATEKILTDTERTAIGTNSAKVSADGSVTTHNDVTDAGSGAIITTAERTKVGFVSVTQAVDLDTIESDTATNNAKVSADGSVTTHNDVTDAGSGIIISGVERTAIGTNSAKVSADGSVTTHNDVTDAGSGAIITTAERNKVGFVAVTQAVDLDTIESDTATNNAKVSADGSVTTHNDVTSAGSGIIISGAERTAIGTNSAKVSADGSVTTHNDVTDAGSGIIISGVERTAIGTNSAKVSADGSVTTHNDITDAGSGAIITTAERNKVGFVSVTQAVDLDTIESDTATNNAKVSADGSVTTHNDVTDAGSGAIITTAERNKVGFVAVTQAVDLDTIESDTATNNAKVSADGSVTTHNDVTDAGSGAIITTAERNKLGNLNEGFLGIYADETALTTAHATASAGQFAILQSTDTVWVWDAEAGPAAWVNSGGTSIGDMFKSVYDPTSVNGDAFSMGNMTETATEKILTDVERTAITTNSAKVSADGSVTTHNDVTDAGSGIIISGAERTAIGTNSAKVSADGSVTTHNDVTDAGSGAIITTAERTKVGFVAVTQAVDLDTIESDTAANTAKLIGIEENAKDDQTLAEVLTTGSVTGGTDITVTHGDDIIGVLDGNGPHGGGINVTGGGSTTGNGGTVFVQGGDGETTGGQGVVAGGDSNNPLGGQGGTLTAQGGNDTDGGHISVTGGISNNGPGGDAYLQGGFGTTAFGNVNIGDSFTNTVEIGSGTNTVNIHGLTYPTADAAAFTPLLTDGAGNLSLSPLTKILSFDFLDARFFGELGLPNTQGWTHVETGSASISVVEETFFGIPQDVLKFDDDYTSSIAAAERALTDTEWQNAYDFGAAFSGIVKLDTVNGTDGHFWGMQATPATNPHPTSTGDRRYGVFLSNSGGNLNLNAPDGGDPFNVTLDGTGGNPLIAYDEEVKVEIVVPAGLGAADVYVNGFLLTEQLLFTVNNGGKGSYFTITSGSANGVNRVFYVANYGATIYESANTLLLTNEDLETNDTVIVTPPGRRDYTVEYPEDATGQAIGATILFSANNVGGTITMTNENPALPKITTNGLSTFTALVKVAGNVIATNSSDGGSAFTVLSFDYIQGISNDKDLDLGTGTLYATDVNINGETAATETYADNVVQPLSTVLTTGNTTNGTNLEVTDGDFIVGQANGQAPNGGDLPIEAGASTTATGGLALLRGGEGVTGGQATLSGGNNNTPVTGGQGGTVTADGGTATTGGNITMSGGVAIDGAGVGGNAVITGGLGFGTVGDVNVGAVSTANVNIGDGANNVIIHGLTHPTADGSAGQVLTTNGAGTLSLNNSNDFTIISDNSDLVVGRMFLDVSATARSNNLPATPSAGHCVEIFTGSQAATNTATITGNGNNIYFDGDTDTSVILNVGGVNLKCVYDGTLWVLAKI